MESLACVFTVCKNLHREENGLDPTLQIGGVPDNGCTDYCAGASNHSVRLREAKWALTALCTVEHLRRPRRRRLHLMPIVEVRASGTPDHVRRASYQGERASTWPVDDDQLYIAVAKHKRSASAQP